MRVLPSRGHRARRGRRAVTMLEFALILPVFMYMLLFVIDMGHLVLMAGAMQDATYSAAHAGAQLGGATYPGANDPGSVLVCGGEQTGYCPNGVSYEALKAAVVEIPGYKADGTGLGALVPGHEMTIIHGGVCESSPSADSYVVIRAEYSTKLLTPGLGAMLSLFGNGTSHGSTWTLTATAAARCGVTRTLP